MHNLLSTYFVLVNIYYYPLFVVTVRQ